MKTIKLFLLVIFISIFHISSYAIPTYELSARNFCYYAPNVLDFDIYLLHTGGDDFKYDMGQYVFNCDPAFANGGILSFQIASGLPSNEISDLPVGLRNGIAMASGNELRVASNAPGSIWNTYTISSVFPGTKIIRVRLQTTAPTFTANLSDLNLTWKNSGGYYTKIASYYVIDEYEYYGENITAPAGHSVVSNLVNCGTPNVITGKVFIDENSNGVMDNSEEIYNKAIISLSPTSKTFYGGIFSFLCTNGDYTMTYRYPPKYYTLSPTSHSASFTGFGQTDANNDFALAPDPGVNDLRVSVIQYNFVRPGRTAFYYITYYNAGTTTQSGTIDFSFDDTQFDFIFTDPVTTPPSGNVVSFSYSNLKPFESRSVSVALQLHTDVLMNTITSASATIFPVSNDFFPSDNHTTSTDLVRTSFDPNDKSVDKPGNITPEEVANEEYLTYKIRFQNTGNDTAFVVKVTDTLSTNVNASSIEMIAASHPYVLNIKEGGTLEWVFDNILLPDSTTNEPESHGFIMYRIRPKNNLVIGDMIANAANIYFDFNEPVITNTVVTSVGPRNMTLDLRFRLEAMFPRSDTAEISIRNSVSPYNEVSAVWITLHQPPPSQLYYRILENIENLSSQNSYYIVVNHRNSLETWSANPVTFSPDTTVYDFTESVSKAYGDNMKLQNGVACIYSGDVDRDGTIGIMDLSAIDNDVLNYASGYVVTDLNGDDIVDAADLSTADDNAFNYVSVQKP